MDREQLLTLDRRHVWHPYATIPDAVIPYPVERADGVTLTLADGRHLLDGMSSWWAAIHGYNHPVLNQAVQEQLQKMAHVMFGGLTHEPAIQLCKTLSDITPTGLNQVFLSDSGSVSMEVAIKMALQYWRAQNKKNKHRLLTIKGGYHGDTFATMAVCDPVSGMHHLFAHNLPQHLFAEKPGIRFQEEWDEKDISSLKQLLQTHHEEIAALVLEPVVQGAGGMWFYSPTYLKRTRELCDEFNVLLICDEIATGFGRTGKLFACEHANISPDILCLGKALTGGYMTLAATLCSDTIAQTVGTLMHGPTFMANPLACSAANASINLLLKNNWQENIQQIEKILEQKLKPAESINGVREVRVLGAIGVIELEKPVNMEIIQPMFVERDIWIRPFGKLVYTMPPFIISNKDLQKICNETVCVIERYLEQGPD
jgi:adenosylmethionine-8-amino-7-oxononanoate aminotransferase